MPNALIPELNGRRLTVDVALKSPTILRSRIAELADDQVLLDKLFHPLGARVESGGLLYSVVQASDFFTTDVESARPARNTRSSRASNPSRASHSSRIGAASSKSPTSNAPATTCPISTSR